MTTQHLLTVRAYGRRASGGRWRPEGRVRRGIARPARRVLKAVPRAGRALIARAAAPGRFSIRLLRMPLPSTPTGRALLGARTALGISTLLAPRLAGKAFSLDP